MSDNLKEFIALEQEWKDLKIDLGNVDCPFEWFAISSRIIDVEYRMLKLYKIVIWKKFKN